MKVKDNDSTLVKNELSLENIACNLQKERSEDKSSRHIQEDNQHSTKQNRSQYIENQKMRGTYCLECTERQTCQDTKIS
jgi:hypothetical protein